MKIPRAVYFAILSAAIAWCCAIIAAPLLASTAGGTDEVGLYRFFHQICHQYPDRTLHVAGHPLAVCARCMAIYVAFLIGVVLFPVLMVQRLSGRARPVLLAAALPMVLDVLLGYFGVHETTNTTRLITGSAFGFGAAIAMIPDAIQGAGALITSLIHIWNSSSKGSPDATETQ